MRKTTSILSELTPALCRAVTGRSDAPAILEKDEFEVAQAILERVMRDSEAAGQKVDQAEVLTNLAVSALQQADFERAGALIHQALALPTSRVSLMQLLMARTWLGMFRGDWAQAAADFLFQRGRVRWAQGRLEEAREIYARMRAAENPREAPEAPVLRQIMRGLLEMAEGRRPQAEQILRRAVSLEQSASGGVVRQRPVAAGPFVCGSPPPGRFTERTRADPGRVRASEHSGLHS